MTFKANPHVYPTQSAPQSEGAVAPAPSQPCRTRCQTSCQTAELPEPYPGCWKDVEFRRTYKRIWQRIHRQREYALRDRYLQAERNQVSSASRFS